MSNRDRDRGRRFESEPLASPSEETPGTVTANVDTASPRPKTKPGRKLMRLLKNTALDGMHQDAGIEYWVPEDKIDRLRKLGVVE